MPCKRCKVLVEAAGSEAESAASSVDEGNILRLRRVLGAANLVIIEENIGVSFRRK